MDQLYTEMNCLFIGSGAVLFKSFLGVWEFGPALRVTFLLSSHHQAGDLAAIPVCSQEGARQTPQCESRAIVPRPHLP